MVEGFRARRDSRGRGLRGVLLPQVPRYRTRSQRFDGVLLDVYEPIVERFGEALAGLDVAVDVVPRMRLDSRFAAWPEDVVAVGPVPLGRLVSAGVDRLGAPTRPRLIVFRRPIEHRAPSLMELEELLRHVVTQLVAVYLNVQPEVVDAKFRRDYLD